METRVLLIAATMVGVATTRANVARAADPTKEQCIASSEQGQELRKAGRLAEARAQFAICVSASCPGPIRDDCAQQLDAIDRATVAPGPAAAPASTRGGAPSSEAPRSASPTTPGETAQRPAGPPPLAYAALGVGGVGLAVGVVAGLVAGGKHSTLAGECDNNAGTCAPQYADDLDSFHAWRTISTVGYVVGALGVAGGVVLLLTAPKTSSTTMAAHVWLGPASAGVAGSF